MKRLVIAYGAEDVALFDREGNTVLDISIINGSSIHGKSFTALLVTKQAAEFYKSGRAVVSEEVNRIMISIYASPNGTNISPES